MKSRDLASGVLLLIGGFFGRTAWAIDDLSKATKDEHENSAGTAIQTFGDLDKTAFGETSKIRPQQQEAGDGGYTPNELTYGLGLGSRPALDVEGGIGTCGCCRPNGSLPGVVGFQSKFSDPSSATRVSCAAS